jgi:hypothetical protein
LLMPCGRLQRENKCGRVMLVSSVAGRVASAGMGACHRRRTVRTTR